MILLPSVAAFPPTSEHKAITPDAWENALDCWIIVIRDLLSRSVEEFSLNIIKDHSFVEFLVSYTRETAFSKSSSRDTAEKTSTLRLSCFFLTHRLLMQMSPVPPELLNPTFLADFSIIFYKSESCRELLESVWDRENLDDNPLIIKSKSTLIQVFETQNMEHKSEFTILIRRTACLLQKSYQYGQFLTLGSDFLESLVTAFERHSAPLQERLVMVGYWALESLLKHRRPRISTLIDHLFTLKSSPRLESFLRRICLSTPFLSRLQARLPSSERDRASGLMQELRAYTSLDDRSRFARSKIKKKKKGKEKRETINSRQDTLTNIHVHKMSFITQVQDLFPDLESRFIVKLLDKHNDDPEQVIAHLLENSSPTNFRVAHEAKTLNPTIQPELRIPHSEPPSDNPTFLKNRRNVYDNDDLDRLAVSSLSLSTGRAKSSATADQLLASGPTSSAKAAILSALATFDSDSDERDDTYDVEDVGGTVDSLMAGVGDDADADLKDKNEEALFAAYKGSPNVFNRDAANRRGKARAKLKTETGMTDEAIEGWAIMIGRDPRRLRRLESKFSTFGGVQRELVPTSYRELPAGSEDSDSGEGPSTIGRRGGRGRGRAIGRGVGRGDVAGPSIDKNTQAARQAKSTSKGSRANHNRRDQRARKMARGGGMAG